MARQHYAREILDNGTLKRYIDEFSITGLTSNPTIFDQAIKNSSAYDETITKKSTGGSSGEELFFDLALEDLTRAADLFRPIHERSSGLDGWVSLEVSPLLAYDAKSTAHAAKDLSARAGRPNLFIKIPGTKEGLPAIEESIFAGVPINITLLFSREQYLAAAEAYLRGIERRIEAGRSADVTSVASVFISRWDAAVAAKVPDELKNRLGIAIAGRTFQAYNDLIGSPRWRRAYNFGARPQRLLWASTGTKDPKASPTLYVDALTSPFTINTMPEGTMKALAAKQEIGAAMAANGGNSEDVLAQFGKAGVDIYALAAQLQSGRSASVRQFLARPDDRYRIHERGARQGLRTPTCRQQANGPPGRRSRPIAPQLPHRISARCLRMTRNAAIDSRSKRWTCTWTIRKIESPAKRSGFSCNWRRKPACGQRSTPCSGATKSISPRIARSCTWLFARRRGRPWWWTAKTWWRPCTPCWIRWRRCPDRLRSGD